MVVLKRTRVHRTDQTSDQYKGIPAHAAAGLHDAIIRVVKENFSPNRGPVLDLAAGSGALTQRLIDGGFDVHPVELSPDSWRVRTVEPTVADFNQVGWTNNLKMAHYSQIVAAEIIEHLDNPRQFLREIYSLLEPNGKIIITTPNPLSAMSVALSLFDSRYYVFDQEYYYTAGHVSMIPTWLLKCHSLDAGLSLMQIETVCEPVFDTAWKTIVFSCWRVFLSIVRRQKGLSKQISMALLERPLVPERE